jgi:hypothetical protein
MVGFTVDAPGAVTWVASGAWVAWGAQALKTAAAVNPAERFNKSRREILVVIFLTSDITGLSI